MRAALRRHHVLGKLLILLGAGYCSVAVSRPNPTGRRSLAFAHARPWAEEALMVATILVIAARVWFALYGRRDDDSEDAAEVRRTGTHRPGTLDLDRSDGPVAADEHPRAGRSPSRRRQQVLYEPVPEVTRRGLSTGGAFLVVLVGAYVVYAVVIMARMRG